MNDYDSQLRRHLRALPDPGLPDRLRDRVIASHGRRRRVIHGATGVAAAVVAVALLRPALPLQDTAPETATVQAPVAPPALHVDEAVARLRAIDRALQAAYERGASDDEVAPLWRAREMLLPSSGRRPDSNPS
ncbi:hypothetical protein [Marilutibacter chinensis]|uniref:Anti sigma-E protein RseA N-terminal domain-containing protein n=1 Tax=Marilutibacter chinensis TaxID=2912247 RepID=A0ABS9HU97_9GAMM|nr:hypothetical protein [Lysobacter chinensis]MCF7222459.1 hypothetical protein [Lysobacter chinensis]